MVARARARCSPRRALLPRASRPTAARPSHAAAPRVAPYGSPRVARCCPARRALLQPARCALLPCASRTAAASAPRPAARAAQAEPHHPTRSALLLVLLILLVEVLLGVLEVLQPSLTSRSAVRLTAAATRTTAFTPYCPRGRAPPSLPTMTSPCSLIKVAALCASEAAALGASESALSGTAPPEALHTFTLNSGAQFLHGPPLCFRARRFYLAHCQVSTPPRSRRTWSLPPSLPRLRRPAFLASRGGSAAPHSSSFPPIEAPLQTLHLDVWGPARVLDRAFYHPTLHRVFPSQDVTFDESVPFYRLFPYRTAPLPPSPLFLALDPPPVVEPVEVTSDSGAAVGGAAGVLRLGVLSLRVRCWGVQSPGVLSLRLRSLGGAEPKGCWAYECGAGGAEPEGAGSGGAKSTGVPLGRVVLLELLVVEALGVLVSLVLEVLVLEVLGAAGTSNAPEAGGVGSGGAAVGGPGLEVLELLEAQELLVLVALHRRDWFFTPPSPSSLPPPDSVLRQVLSLPSSTGLPLQPGAPLFAPSPYTKQTDWITGRREPTSRPASPVRACRTGSRVPRERPPPVPSTHAMAIRPSFVPQRVPLPSPPASSLHDVADPESDLFRAAHPTVTRLLATLDTDPLFQSAAASALVSEGECALGTDFLEDRQEDFECLAAAVPLLSWPCAACP
ncbi:unnamed protein product [Closterium sp. NIES-64]|nr:unnamed protein product [Closterium sp. NIES-64]